MKSSTVSTWVHSHYGLEDIFEKSKAHQLYDKMFLNRHKHQRVKKRRTSLKSWMFKFKHRSLQGHRSQRDPYLAIDRSLIRYAYLCSRVHDGSMVKGNNANYWRMMKGKRRDIAVSSFLRWSAGDDQLFNTSSALCLWESSELVHHRWVANSTTGMELTTSSQGRIYFSVGHCWRKKNLQIISSQQWHFQTSLHFEWLLCVVRWHCFCFCVISSYVLQPI